MRIPEILKQPEGKSLEFKKEIPTNKKVDSQVVAELRRQARNISLGQEVDPSFDCEISSLMWAPVRM